MKKSAIITTVAIMMTGLVACGSQKQGTPQAVIEKTQQVSSVSENSQSVESVNDSNTNNGSNILIAYFTVPETDGVDTVGSASRVVTENGIVGNTEYVATEIQKNMGGDLFAIKTVQEYPSSHQPLLDFAYDEKSNNKRPELAAHIENLDKYDYIFVGYPNWNSDLPMPLYTFFEEYDFSGKTIIPFTTHGGSGLSNTIRTIEKLQPNSSVVEVGLSISRDKITSSQTDIKNWTSALLAD